MKSFLRMVRYSRPYWGLIAISMVASLAVGGTDAGFAYLVKPLLEKIFSENNYRFFLFIPVGIVAISLLRGVCRFMQNYFISIAGQRAIQDIRNDLYQGSMGLSMRFFSESSTGMLMSRVLVDVGSMQNAVSSVVTGLLKESFSAVALLGVVFYRDWQLALISFIVLPATAVPAQIIGKKIKRYAKQGQEQVGGLAAILQESYSGIKVVKAFALEEQVKERFRQGNRNYYQKLLKVIKYDAMHTPIMEVITSFGVAGVVLVGGLRIKAGYLTTAEFFSFLTAMIMLYSPVKRLLSSYNAIQQALAGAERVFELMDTRSEVVDPPQPVPLPQVRGDVSFRDCSFAYGDELVLNNVNLEARKGEVVALVGPSGGGKSTLVSLLLRFYDVSSGSVTIDGVDVRQVRQAELLQHIAMVDQETTLFNDSIANNIRLGKPGASDAEVEAAARIAYADEFIRELPDGYATEIGDRGVRLSGGQRQRLCIARAVLKDAPVLILDEATSALDTESEQQVQAALDNLMANRTTFVIAHRLSTILHADQIVVLDRGEIVERGGHEELLARDGLYRKLCDKQFGMNELPA